MKDKINVLMLGDHPLHTSGVAHCIRDICGSLVGTGNFRIICLGAAMKHEDYRPMKIHDDVVVIPVEGFGSTDLVNKIIHENKINIIFMQSDPRFYTWLLNKDNEIRCNVPIVWYTVWDNYPYPVFNSWVWNSVDVNVAISKLTEDLIRVTCPKASTFYQPHSVNNQIFAPQSLEQRNAFKQNAMKIDKDKFVVFWNNRNGRRKNAGMLISAFAKFAKEVGKDKVYLLLKTDAIDPVGYNIPELIRGFELEDCCTINSERLEETIIANIYNAVDVTINISNNEGFGMGTLESLSCGTPVIATWTGGMREQICDNIDDPKEFYGIPLFPATKTIIGSPELPWINEDQVSEQSIVEAFLFMFHLSKEQRLNWGAAGYNHVQKNFSWNKFCNFWPDLFMKIHESHGSWPNKNYTPYRFKEVTCTQRYESTKNPMDLPPSTNINESHFIQFLKNYQNNQK